jgi:hypothetical protein
LLSSTAQPSNIANYARISPIADENTLKYRNGVFSINSDYFNNSNTGFVHLSGDTLNGFITLHSEPELQFHAATKGYTDNKFDDLKSQLGGSYVHLSGDLMTGPLEIQSTLVVTEDVQFSKTLTVANSAKFAGGVDCSDQLLTRFIPNIKNILLGSSDPDNIYQLQPEDNGCILALSASGENCKVYCPEDFPIGFNVMIIQNSTSNVYVLKQPNTNVTVNQIDGYTKIRKPYGVCNTVVIDTNKYILAGDLA